MTDAMFTPGPWAVTSSTGDVHCQVRSGQNWICQGPNPGAPASPPSTEIKANARLIAAAPELLDALQLVWDTYGMDPSVDSSIWQTVRAAITKALGQ